MRWRQTGVIRRLVLLTLVVGLSTGVVGVMLVRYFEERDALQAANDRNVGVAERSALVTDGTVLSLESQVKLLAAQPSIATLATESEVELAVALRVSSEFDELRLYDDDGRPVAAASSTRLLDADSLPRREDSGRAETTAEIIVDGPEPVLEIVTPVEDPPGTRVGTLVARVSTALLLQRGDVRLIATETTPMITTTDGRIVAHRERDRVLGGETLPLGDVFANGQQFGRYRHDGTTFLVASAPLAQVPGWVVVEQPERRALEPVQTTADEVTAVFLTVIMAIMAAVVVYGRHLLRPLRPLASAVERLGAGDRSARVEPAGEGEVLVLAEGFNRMAASLQERQERLEEAEAQARQSEERLRLMIESVRDYAIMRLDEAGHVLSWNTGARRLTGYTADEALGRPLLELLGCDEVAEDPTAQASHTGRGDAEGWCHRADGGAYWARVVITPLAAEHDGSSSGFAAVIHDLTDRQAARDAMVEALRREQEASEELRRTNQLKDEFLAIAAHEIRTPLSTILGASDVLAHDWDDLSEAEKRRFRDIIQTHAEDMRQVVERLLDLTRLQAGRVRLSPETFPLRDELESHLALLERHTSAHVVRLDAPPDEVTVDRAALRHIVTNLLTNAAKYSPDGTEIVVQAAVEDGSMVVVVRDQGVGIPPEEHAEVFDLFRQSSRRDATARGTGVGLSIVKRYVDLLEGSVELESSPDRGSTFTVTIPLNR